MNILFVQDTDCIRRNPIQHTHLADRLAVRGHQVRFIDYEILWREEGRKELFSRRQTYTISRILEGANVSVVRPGILKIPLLEYVSMLWTYSAEINRQIREFRPDVVIGNDILTPLLAYRAARKRHIPTVFYAIDIEHRLIPLKFLQPLGKLIESRNIRASDLVLSINEGLREYTIKMGAEPGKTKVIRAGIDSGRYDPGLSGAAARQRYGIAKDDKVLFFMGWLYHFSGLKEVAAELSRLGDPKVKLLVVGDGDAYEDLRQLRDRYGLGDRLILTGKRPFEEVPELIAAADVCLLPAYDNEIMRDIVPIKMYEYMAMGKPVVSTRLSGVAKEFGDGNGVLYVDRPEAALGAAAHLISSDLAAAEGRKARAFVERCDWSAVTDEFESVLRGCVAHG